MFRYRLVEWKRMVRLVALSVVTLVVSLFLAIPAHPTAGPSLLVENRAMSQALDAWGRPWAAWEADDGHDTDIYYSRWTGQAWQQPRPLSADPEAFEYTPTLAFTTDGTAWAAWATSVGPEGKGMLSFPKPGVSYALDIPISRDTQRLVHNLNELVIAEGGRIYLAKDAFTRADQFRAMEARLDAWNAVRRKWDPQGELRSAQSVRVLGDAA